MKKKLMKNIIMAVVCFCCAFLFKNITVNAAMADEAEDYDLGEFYSGRVNGTYGEDSERYGARVFKFSIPEKSHVSLWCWYKDNGYGGTIYNSSGKAILKIQDLEFTKNETTGWSSANQYRVLPSGTYYLKIDDNGSFGIQSFDFKFKIQAEKQIKLPKGSINSLKGNKKGQMTVKCKSVQNAIGYRIQYSTDYRFKKGVKTVYSPTIVKNIKGLKKGAIYYVKVSPYNVYDDGHYAFGQNSYIKKVVIK